MKRIDSCRKTDLLVGLLFAGVVAVLLAYRIFAYLCAVTAFSGGWPCWACCAPCWGSEAFFWPAGHGNACNICVTILRNDKVYQKNDRLWAVIFLLFFLRGTGHIPLRPRPWAKRLPIPQAPPA